VQRRLQGDKGLPQVADVDHFESVSEMSFQAFGFSFGRKSRETCSSRCVSKLYGVR
jgi:hypothetical protein